MNITELCLRSGLPASAITDTRIGRRCRDRPSFYWLVADAALRVLRRIYASIGHEIAVVIPDV
jgi:hypothetical protein